MPIDPKSMQFKLWLMLLFISAILVFIGYQSLQHSLDSSLKTANNPELSYSDTDYQYAAPADNTTIEEGLFSEFQTQKTALYLFIVAISLAFVIGFVLKFVHDQKKNT